MMLTRRFFIGGLASSFALGANRVFAATGKAPEFPKGAFTVSVRAVSCWNRRSTPLVKTVKAVEV